MKNSERYAKALDMYLDGKAIAEIGREFGVSRERARQIVRAAAHVLAYRTFKGVSRHFWRFDRGRGKWTVGK